MNNRARVTYILLLAGAAAATLVVGFTLRPQKRPQPTVSEADRFRLGLLAGRDNRRNTSAYLTEQAQRFSDHIIHVQEMDTSGIVWDNTSLLAVPARDAPRELSVRLGLDTPTQAARLERAGAPVMWLRSAQLRSAPAMKRAAPQSGEDLLLVARSADGQLLHVASSYAGLTTATCDGQEREELLLSVTVQPAFVGGGVFTLDGTLAGMVLPCGSRMHVVPSRSIAALQEDQPVTTLISRDAEGLRGQAATLEQVPRALQRSGVTVPVQAFRILELRREGSGYQAGMRPGDLLLPDGAVPGLSNEWLVLREGRLLRLRKPAPAEGSSRAAEAGFGVGFAPALEGVPIAEVKEGSRAAQSGLQREDRLLRIGATTVTSAPQAERLLQNMQAATPLWIQRGNTVMLLEAK